jgi:hypothetical protein
MESAQRHALLLRRRRVLCSVGFRAAAGSTPAAYLRLACMLQMHLIAADWTKEELAHCEPAVRGNDGRYTHAP